MSDRLTRAERSALMSRVRNRDTRAEMIVRRAVHAAGFRYRVNVRKLPGSPDLAFGPRKLAVFVHGCFWHGHSCRRGRLPATNAEFWAAKVDKNIARDLKVAHELRECGWTPITIWECQLKEGTNELVRQLALTRQLGRP